MPARLYWCWTEDHCEDWFVVSRRADRARRFFADSEGFYVEDVHAAPVKVLPRAAVQLQKYELPSWPTEEVLTACGARLVVESIDPRRRALGQSGYVVELDGHLYKEGDLIKAVSEGAEPRGWIALRADAARRSLAEDKQKPRPRRR